MKISFKWLSDLIDIKDYPTQYNEICKKLTAAGLEVEGLQNESEAYKNVVIGFLQEVGTHPDADRLTLCKVDVGEPEPRQIICGATNHKQGDYIVAALPGAVLPGDFAIKKSKIRGVESHGMLCSQKELGLGGDSDGIITLAEGKIGQTFSEAFGKDDIIVELNVTPNRADCLSHLGLAYELSANIELPVFKPTVKLKPSKTKTSQKFKLDISSEDCPRYAGMLIENVKVGDSPSWLVEKLEAIGLRSVNNIVDVTNFVLFEYGQPLHAFDAENLKGDTITVSSSIEGETFKALDGVEHALTGQELVIKDQSVVIALAGVIGGEGSAVTDSTSHIFLESAFFNAKSVRQTSRRLGIDTDACYRFSRGVNPEWTIEAMKRAAQLIAEVSGGEVAADFVEHYPKTFKKEPIAFDVKYIGQRLGYEVTDKEFSEVMKRLDCQVKGGKVIPPVHRWDLEIQEDLVEEYGRINGYDKLGETLPPLVRPSSSEGSGYWQKRKVSEYLRGAGFSQAVNYAFLSSEFQNLCLGEVKELSTVGLGVGKETLVKNPISKEFEVMRRSLLSGLAQNVFYNARRGQLQGQLFELGSVHGRDEDSFNESGRIAMTLWTQSQGLWKNEQPAVYRLKSAIENLISFVSSKNKIQWRKKEIDLPLLHPEQSVVLFMRGKECGVIGSLHPSLRKKEKLRCDVAFAELDLDLLLQTLKTPSFKTVSSYPTIEKDMALVMPEGVLSADVEAELKKASGQLLHKIEVVDRYQGESTGGLVSLAYRLHYQSKDKTLEDEHVNDLFFKAIERVEAKLGVKLRS